MHFYVLEDCSGRMSVTQWARKSIDAYYSWQADRIVVETNMGGDLVRATLKNVDDRVPVKGVDASRGKIIRAEPVSALYEQGLVHHVGEFIDLEMEMTSFTGAVTDSSPDRMDALVWGISELSQQVSVQYQSTPFY